MELIRYIFALLQRIESFLQVTSTGYMEHFIAGALIGGLVSWFVFKRANHKMRSVIFGITVAFFIGLFKEMADPYLRGDRDKTDLAVTVLGSMLGSLVILKKSQVPKNQLKKRTS